MKTNPSSLLGIAFATAFLCHSSSFCLAAPGSLTPPGPPAPTMTTLDAIDAKLEKRTPISSLPFTITAPGSYYITGDLTGVTSSQGINVAANDVTIDLNGFTLRGVPGSFHGVYAGQSKKNLTVCNGVVRDWGFTGVQVSGATNSTTTLRDIQSVANGQRGFALGPGTVVENCIAEGNGTDGFSLSGGVATRCDARNNGKDGFTGGIQVVRECSSRSNVEDGFDLSSCTVDGCISSFNTAVGIANPFGVTTACRANSNGGNGILLDGNSGTVTGCICQFNGGNGIEVANDAVVRNNVCDENGFQAADGAGIHATGSRSRIEGNHVISNDRGIDVDGTGNFIVGNTAVLNTTQYDIVANNKVGIIVAAPNSIAILGPVGGSGVGSTDPWANFSY